MNKNFVTKEEMNKALETISRSTQEIAAVSRFIISVITFLKGGGHIFVAALAGFLVGTSGYLAVAESAPLLTLHRQLGENFVISNNQFAEEIYASAGNQLGAVSLSNLIENLKNIKERAFSEVTSDPTSLKLRGASKEQETSKSQTTITNDQITEKPQISITNDQSDPKPQTQAALTTIREVIRPADLTTLREELLREMANYALSFKAQELHPTVTRQSDADASRRSVIVQSITNNQTFTSPSFTNASGDFSSISFTTGSATNLTLTGSTTLQSFTATNSTTTNATSTTFFATTGDFTTLCLSQDCKTTWPAGIAWPFTKLSTNEQATSTTLLFTNGLITTASSTLASTTISNLLITSSATSTNFFTNNLLTTGSSTIQSLFSNSATSTNLYGTNFLVTGSSTLQSFSAQYASTTQIQTATNAYFAISGGSVGIGTTTPATKLTVSSPISGVTDGIEIHYPSSAGGGSSGPRLIFTGLNGPSATKTYASIGMLINGSSAGSETGELTFSAMRGAGVLTEAMRIDEAGNVGIGTTNPTGLLHLRVADNSLLKILGVKGGQVAFVMGFTADASQNFYVGTGETVGSGGVYMTNGGTSWTSNSDERLKTNINTLASEQGLSAILELNPVAFNWRDPNLETKTQYGLIAQEVQRIFPDVVTLGSVSSTTPDGALGVTYTSLIAPMIKAIQEVASISGVFKTALITWFADAANGITKLFAKEVETELLCVSDGSGNKTCITKAELDTILANAGTSGAPASQSGPAAPSESAETPEEDLASEESVNEDTASSTPEITEEVPEEETSTSTEPTS